MSFPTEEYRLLALFRFCEETWQERLDRSEAKWRKKLYQLRAAA
jgi:hypothetical protein